MPKPSVSAFSNFLFEYYGFADFYKTSSVEGDARLQAEANNFLQFSSAFFEKTNLSLRQQEKIFSHLRVSLKSFNSNNHTIPPAFILITFLYQFNFQLYFRIRNRQLLFQEFVNEIEALLYPCSSKSLYPFILYTDAALIHLYKNYYLQENRKFELYTLDSTQHGAKLQIESIIDTSVNKQDLLKRILAFESSTIYDVGIDYLLNKVELLEPLN